MSDEFTQLLARVETEILGPDGKPLTRLTPVVVDRDCPTTTIYLIPSKIEPEWTEEDIARRSAVIRDVRLR